MSAPLTPDQVEQTRTYLKQHGVAVPERFLKNFCKIQQPLEQLTQDEAREAMRKARELYGSAFWRWMWQM